jgi:hypothetical protein
MLAEIPGVAGVAEGISPLGAEARVGSPKTIRLGDRQQQLLIGRLSGGPALLSTLGVPLIAGRHLTAADASGLPVPVVITQSLAEAIWREPVRALGEVFSIAEGRAGPFQVVGISGNLAFGSLTDTNSGVVVTAQGGTSAVVSNFALRTDHPEIVAETVRRTVRGQVVRVSTGAEVVTRDLGRQRLGAFFLSGFGFVALILGVGGAFGLVSYLAASQRREFAIRLSLGASPGNLVWTAMNAAVGPVLIGIVLGTMASAAIAQLFSSLLVGVATVDIATYSTVAVMFTSAAVLATLLAAWNLRRVNAADGVRAS